MPTNQVVTNLVVNADGAIQALGRVDKAYDKAGKSADRMGSLTEATIAQISRQRQAMEAGIPVITARTEAVSREQRAYQSAMSRIDPIMKARTKAERDLSKLVASSSNLVVQGKLNEEEALQNVARAQQFYEDQIQGAVAAQQRMADSSQNSAAAMRRSTTALRSANSAMGDSAFNTGNVAAQFQDVAVTAQMGMNPMLIAVQQGTQLSAVLNTMQNPVRGLGVALMSMLNPVSLLTIGFVGLTAAAVQWIGSATQGSEDSVSALEEHNKWLDEILAGYEAARDAANEAAEAADKMPREIVQSDLARQEAESRADLEQQTRSLAEAQSDLNDLVASFGNMGVGPKLPEDLANLQRLLDDADISADSSLENLEDLRIQVRDIADNIGDGSARNRAEILEQAESFEELLDSISAARAEVESLQAAQRELGRGFSMVDSMPGVADAIERVKNNTVDLRTEQERLQDQFARDVAGARTISELNAIVAAYNNMESAAQAAAWAVANSGDAAIVAAGQYGTATGAANAYANALWNLGNMIPEVAARQASMQQLQQAETEYNKAQTAAQDLLSKGAIGRQEYNERLSETSSRLEQAQDAIIGVTALQETLDRQTEQNSIGALDGEAAARARVNQQYEEQAERIRELANNGASQAEVEQLLAQNSNQLSAALGNVNSRFEKMASASGAKAAGACLTERSKNDADKLLKAISQRLAA